jgi:YHS domain-containing protein
LCAGETLAGVDPHPGGQRARLDRLAADGVARITYVECLDECERGDVVVARPSPSRRAAGVGPVWFERLAGDALTGDLQQWLNDGGPGVVPVPERLAAVLIERTGDPVAARQAVHAAHHHDEPAQDRVGQTSVTDPVCGMSVDPATAAATAELDGTAYYFCAQGCLKAFVAEPGRYV